MKVNHNGRAHLPLAADHAGLQSGKVQAHKRRRAGIALEPGEMHHSTELEELAVIHHQHKALLKRRKSRRKGDVENPEESQSEQAIETETMVLHAYTRAAKNMTIKVSARDRGGRQGHSDTGQDAQRGNDKQTLRGLGNLKAFRTSLTRDVSKSLAELGKNSDLNSTRSKLLELAHDLSKHDPSHMTERNPIRQAMRILQLYLSYSAQSSVKLSPTTLLEVRSKLLEIMPSSKVSEPTQQSLTEMRNSEIFYLFLPIWLLQLHRPRRKNEIQYGLARISSLVGYP
jgi:hypothetical protein